MSGTISHNDHCSTSADNRGVLVHITCPVCERQIDICYPWQEVKSLLDGRQVPGHVADGKGWQTSIKCMSNSGTGCGRPIRYRVGVQDFVSHYRNKMLGSGQNGG
jgi:hypothetical protein